MNNETKNHSSEHYSGSHCPQEIPASVKDNLFCTELKCPEKIPTKRFSSPTTSLSPEEFEKQKQCIEQINNLLITLTSPRDPENLTGLRLHFRSLRGILIEVEFDCDDTKENINGLLKNAGRDYLEVEDIGKKYFIPYQGLCMIDSNDCDSPVNHGSGELEDINECLKRDIVLNFGKVVSSNPDLINIFFGIPLYLELVQFIGCQVIVRIQEDPNIIEGELIASTQDKICIKDLDNTIQDIKIVDICNIII